MKTTLSTLAAAAALLALAPNPAQAYWGFGVGPSKIDINCAGTLTCDRTDTGGKLYLGWNLPGPFAIEASLIDWGKARSTSPAGLGGANDLKTRARGLAVDGVYVMTFGWGQCDVRAGMAYNRARTTVTVNGTASSGNHNLTAPHAGFGCAYPLMPGLTLAATLDLSRVKYTAQDKANSQLITIGLRF